MSLPMKELVEIGKRCLEEAGKPDAKIDSQLLYRHFFKVDSLGMLMDWATIIDENSCEAYLRLVELRASGVPLQHIVGSQEFMGLEFKVNQDVLIPRQETELLVEEVLKALKERKKARVLDLCCGSGAIIVSLAKLSPEGSYKWFASDLSPKALKVARENAETLGARDIKFNEGDLFAGLSKAGAFGGYDIIVSNPPYIPVKEIETLQIEVRDHEPIMALDGGEDGLDFYRRILSQAPLYLRKNGSLFLEIGHDQGPALKDMAENQGDWSQVEVLKDLSGRDRIVILQKKL